METDPPIEATTAVIAPVPFDASNLRLTETDTMSVLDPISGQPTTWVWTLAGLSHPATLEWQAQSDREALEEEERINLAIRTNPNWVHKPTPRSEIRRRNVRQFAARVVGWTPVRIDGADYPCTRANVVSLLSDPAWDRVLAQLGEFLGAKTSFTRRSDTSR